MHNMIIEVERGGPMVTNTNLDYIGTQISPAVARQNITERETFVNVHITRYVTVISITSFKVTLLNIIGCDMVCNDNTR
jgi:hypothetical protein